MALTTRFGIEIPDVGADSDTWGTILNAYFNSLETKVFDKTAGDSVTGNVSITGNLSYTGTLTGGTGIINIGSGQIYKDAAGNLLVGTATLTNGVSATEKTLVVRGSAANEGASVVVVNQTGQGAGYIGCSTINNDFYVFNKAATALLLGTDNTERARITSAGYFKASNTGAYSDPVEAPVHSLEGSSGIYVAGVYGKSASGGAAVLFSQITTANAYQALYEGYNGTTLTYRVLANGDVQNSNNSYGAISDQKLKENITPATNKLDDLMKVEFVNFNFIADPTKRKQFGVIAQQLETVFPGLVESTPDTEEVEVTDDEGNVTKERKETGTVTKSVNYSVLALMACKALQEANTKIESLTQRITQLEAK